MAGLIYHLIFGIILAAIVYYKFKNLQYSTSIFIGNLLHYIFIFAYAPFLLKSFNPTEILYSSYFTHRDIIFNFIWMATQIIFISIFLFFQRYVRKKKFKDLEYNLGFVLLGIIIHAILDFMIQETGIWI